MGHLDEVIVVIEFKFNRTLFLIFFFFFLLFSIRSRGRLAVVFPSIDLHHILHTQRTRLVVRQPLFNATEMVIMPTPTDLAYWGILLECILANATSFGGGAIGHE